MLIILALYLILVWLVFLEAQARAMGLGIWATEFETVPSPWRQHSKKSR